MDLDFVTHIQLLKYKIRLVSVPDLSIFRNQIQGLEPKTPFQVILCLFLRPSTPTFGLFPLRHETHAQYSTCQGQCRLLQTCLSNKPLFSKSRGHIPKKNVTSPAALDSTNSFTFCLSNDFTSVLQCKKQKNPMFSVAFHRAPVYNLCAGSLGFLKPKGNKGRNIENLPLNLPSFLISSTQTMQLGSGVLFTWARWVRIWSWIHH